MYLFELSLCLSECHCIHFLKKLSTKNFRKLCRIMYYLSTNLTNLVCMYIYIYVYIYVYIYRNSAVATRPFDVGPSNFHTMTSLESDGAFWKKILKNFSNFKMAAIFRSKMTKKQGRGKKSCFMKFLDYSGNYWKWINLNKRICTFYFGYCFVLCLI